MRYIRMKEGLTEVSVIGAGCMRIADMDLKEADAFVRGALDLGINFFDEADIYGRGRSQRCI